MKRIVGYYFANREMPIYETKQGTVTTRAFVHCCQCGKAIKTQGGPIFNAWCLPCVDNPEK